MKIVYSLDDSALRSVGDPPNGIIHLRHRDDQGIVWVVNPSVDAMEFTRAAAAGSPSGVGGALVTEDRIGGVDSPTFTNAEIMDAAESATTLGFMWLAVRIAVGSVVQVAMDQGEPRKALEYIEWACDAWDCLERKILAEGWA